MVYDGLCYKQKNCQTISASFSSLFTFVLFELHTKRKPMRTCSLWSVTKGNCTNTTTVLFGCIRLCLISLTLFPTANFSVSVIMFACLHVFKDQSGSFPRVSACGPAVEKAKVRIFCAKPCSYRGHSSPKGQTQ